MRARYTEGYRPAFTENIRRRASSFALRMEFATMIAKLICSLFFGNKFVVESSLVLPLYNTGLTVFDLLFSLVSSVTSGAVGSNCVNLCVRSFVYTSQREEWPPLPPQIAFQPCLRAAPPPFSIGKCRRKEGPASLRITSYPSR